MFLGIEHFNNYLLMVSVMDRGSKVIQVSPYTVEGLFHLIDHSDVRVIAFNFDFNANFNSTLSNRALKNLNKNLYEYFEFRVIENIEKKSFRSIVYTDTEEFFKKIIRKDVMPIHTPEGIEQRLYNIPKTGIRLNRNILSKSKEIVQRQINAIVLSYTAYCYHNNNYEVFEEEESFYIVPKYRYVPLKDRESPEKNLSK